MKKIIAICYDFDKTLSPNNMQEQGFIQSLGLAPEKFWQDTNALSKAQCVESNLAYMLKMVEGYRSLGGLTREKLNAFGKDITLFKGVESWFSRINACAESLGGVVEHYIISSGIKEIIQGTKIAKYFKKIYASAFAYDKTGVAVWPSQVINYTNKTQFLFRIEKGVLDELDDSVNDRFSNDKKRIPFSNIIYIGDSDTDVPCMRLVKSLGGYSVGVYGSKKDRADKMLIEGRITDSFYADYGENSPLELAVKKFIKEKVKE